MIIYNTTYHVDDMVYEKYIDYIKNTYIIKALSGGFLLDPRFARIHPQHEENGKSYSLQFKVKNIDALNYWFSKEGQQLQEELTNIFGDKVLGFATILEEIEI